MGRRTRRHDVGLVDGGERDDRRDIIRSNPREHRGSMLLRDEGEVAGPQDLERSRHTFETISDAEYSSQSAYLGKRRVKAPW